MREVITRKDQWISDDAQKLFSFYVASNDTVVLRRGSFLHLCHRLEFEASTAQDDITISRLELITLLQHHLVERLRVRVSAENDICTGIERDGNGDKHDSHLGASVFDPCPNIATSGWQCVEENCSRVHDLDEGWYNRKVRFYLQQLAILDTFQRLPHSQDFPTRMRHKR